MNVTKINYQGWQNSRRLSNGVVDLVLTVDVGPRLIRFGFVDGENEFKEYPEQAGKTGGEEWRIYGGHRLWHSPESMPRSYAADNRPVGFEEFPDLVRLVQPVEATTGIQKEIDVALPPDAAHARVTHRLRNCSLWSIRLAPWAMSVMSPGGSAVLPLPPRQPYTKNISPTNSLTFWAYTDMTDPRWTWGRRFVLLRQDPAQTDPQKVGLMAPDGWIAYARAGHLFVKRAAFAPGGSYPDFGASLEAYTNADMLEAETLGPLAVLEPGGAIEHVEDWFLFADVPVPHDDIDVIAGILPKIALTTPTPPAAPFGGASQGEGGGEG
jgi:hypothetical protein